MAHVLEPLVICVSFLDDALWCPGVQVDLWTNLAEAQWGGCDAALVALEAAVTAGHSLALLRGEER